ncbi:putative asmA protein [Legionella geestiana]|uniref:Putative asmA protein n=1 Tax=Legionella geestiana TaxID=45065 RepID=A0A0W0TQA3_9GAMM|nr:AsmA family protein [Legionella geestiana]KTC97493.1 putative asmA protein [Legionella geestiana]QBS13302.1 AsmA family protein [Legionella geestiana]QDQ40895.1 AsmA family protein [Legionella geestiana]STX54171.1 putative asmA protein [Legionella geestiana]
MKILKRVALAVAFILIISSVLLWGLTQSISKDTLSEWINARLSSIAGQPARIEGGISWQLLPAPGVRAAKIRIGGDEPDITIDDLLLRLDTASLLRAKPIFSAVIVDGVQIQLRKSVKPAPTNKTPSTTAGASSVPAAFAIHKFMINRGSVIIDDGEQHIRLSNLQLSADDLNLGNTRFPLQFKAKITAKTPSGEIVAPVRFTGHIRLDGNLLQNPEKALSQLELNGQSSIQKLRINSVHVDSVESTLQAKNGVLTLKPLSIKLYGGTSVGMLLYQLNNRLLTLSQTANNLDTAKLAADAAGFGAFSGRMDFSLHASSRFDGSDVLKNITGNGNLSIKDGELRGIDLNAVLKRVSLQLDKLAKTTESTLQPETAQDTKTAKTAFRLLSLSYSLRDGVLGLQPLLIQTDSLQLKGDGQLTLETGALKARLNAVTQTEGVTLAVLQKSLGGNLPLLLTGTLSAPVLMPDMQVLTPLLAREAVSTLTKNPEVKKIGKQISALVKNLR